LLIHVRDASDIPAKSIKNETKMTVVIVINTGKNTPIIPSMTKRNPATVE